MELPDIKIDIEYPSDTYRRLLPNSIIKEGDVWLCDKPFNSYSCTGLVSYSIGHMVEKWERHGYVFIREITPESNRDYLRDLLRNNNSELLGITFFPDKTCSSDEAVVELINVLTRFFEEKTNQAIKQDNNFKF